MNKESLILDHLYSKPQASQRELAVATGISLGQINLILQRLCSNGLLRSERVAKKKTNYTLTQVGLAERTRRINEHLIFTVKGYNKIKSSCRDLLDRLYNDGYRRFVLEGERGEMHEVISNVFEEHFNGKASLSWGPAEGGEGQVILNLNRRFVNGQRNVVNVLEEIAL